MPIQPESIPYINKDQSTSTVYLYQSEEASSLPVIIILPAMGMKASYYAPLAEELAKNGMPSITADLRGKGESNIRPSKKVDFGYHEMIEQDIESVVQKAKDRFPDRKLMIMGHSLGGQLASLYTAKYPGRIDGLILVACCSVYYGGWEGLAQYRILMGTQFIGLLSTLAGYFPGRRVGFGGTNAKSVMQDWSRQSRTGNYVLNNDDHDYEASLSMMEKPVLTISFQGDNFAPLSAVKHLLAKFSPSAPIEIIHLKRKDVRNDRFNHFNWPKKPGNIVKLVKDWVDG